MIRHVAAIAVLLAVAAVSATPAHADPPPPWNDPHYPDRQHGSCAGGRGGWIVYWCDGEHYPDGTYWHQVFNAGADAVKPQCVRQGDGPTPEPAPGGCGGFG